MRRRGSTSVRAVPQVSSSGGEHLVFPQVRVYPDVHPAGALPRAQSGFAAQGKGAGMVPSRLRLWIAGLVAFLLGVPLAKEAYAQSLGDFVGFVIDASIYASDGDS